MLFNSLDFAVFLPVVFVLYWFVLNDNIRLQNALIVVASYFFYGWWDWRFLIFIFLSTIVDFFIAQAISTQARSRSRTLLLIVSLILNLGVLAILQVLQLFPGKRRVGVFNFWQQGGISPNEYRTSSWHKLLYFSTS